MTMTPTAKRWDAIFELITSNRICMQNRGFSLEQSIFKISLQRNSIYGSAKVVPGDFSRSRSMQKHLKDTN